MFDDGFIARLPDNPQLAGKKICDAFEEFHGSLIRAGETVKGYENYLKALAVLRAVVETRGIDLELPLISRDVQVNIDKIVQFFRDTRGVFDHEFIDATSGEYKKVFERKFGTGFFYEFSDGDLKRIQVLIGELREIISKTKELDEDHKSRLLKRLEKLQSELHKRVSDLDRFWGLLIDGSIVLTKVGENAKPIIDRIQEIVNIIWRVQARAEELPSNIPLELPSGEKQE